MRITYHRAMTGTKRARRRADEKTATRGAILEAARRVAARDGARALSLRGVAAEAGFAPAALYGYFRNKDELLVALAAEDLSGVARAMRGAVQGGDTSAFAAAASLALAFLRDTETMAAASAALPALEGEAARHFNGRLIQVLTALSDATGRPAGNRGEQTDVILLAATLTGLATLARTGRLEALGFGADELLKSLEARFSKS